MQNARIMRNVYTQIPGVHPCQLDYIKCPERFFSRELPTWLQKCAVLVRRKTHYSRSILEKTHKETIYYIINYIIIFWVAISNDVALTMNKKFNQHKTNPNQFCFIMSATAELCETSQLTWFMIIPSTIDNLIHSVYYDNFMTHLSDDLNKGKADKLTCSKYHKNQACPKYPTDYIELLADDTITHGSVGALVFSLSKNTSNNTTWLAYKMLKYIEHIKT